MKTNCTLIGSYRDVLVIALKPASCCAIREGGDVGNSRKWRAENGRVGDSADCSCYFLLAAADTAADASGDCEEEGEQLMIVVIVLLLLLMMLQMAVDVDVDGDSVVVVDGEDWRC